KPVRCDNHRHVRVQSFVNERLVVAISAQDDGRMRAASHDLLREPGGYRSLARAANAVVAYPQCGYGRCVLRQTTRIVECIAHAYAEGVQRLDRSQHGTGAARDGTVIVPDPLDQAHFTLAPAAPRCPGARQTAAPAPPRRVMSRR